jgi:hypothetical protein
MLNFVAGCALVMALSATSGFAEPMALHVSPRGDDANAGTREAPFESLERARDAVAELRGGGPLPEGGVTVWVDEGLYEVRETLRFEAQHGGETGAPVVFRAREGTRPVIVGGRAISDWQPYRGSIVMADMTAQGLRDVYFRQLLCNGERMDLARYPNRDPNQEVTGGWAYVDGAYLPMYADIAGEPQNVLRYKAEDEREWARPEEGEVMVFPRYNWWNNLIRIASVDRAARTYTLTGNASYAIRPGDRYYVRNLFEELDAPGEWYLDRETWTLYFWPPEGVDPATMTVVAPVVRTILSLGPGAEHISFRGFTFECSEGTALTLNGTNDCQIAQCTIRNVGDYDGSGVTISGGRNNGVAGCDIYNTGRDAISLDGGDFDTLEPAGNYADNNYIHHPGIFYKQGVGVGVGGVGNRISHNLMHDCPRFGIGWGGNDHVFEYNEIRHCNLETADCGAIYSWQVDWSKRGTEIRYNYLHDIVGFGWENGKWTSPHMNWGVYLDDGTCGVHVHGNIVARTILGGVHYHGGRDNVVENNILVDGRDSQVQYSGYVKGGHPVPMMTDTWNKFHGTPAYGKYPGYAELTQSLEDAWQMAGNKFRRNVVSYREPSARLYAHYNLPYDKTDSDFNVIWHEGGPLLTGVTALKGLVGPNLVPNPDFEAGAAGETPPGWRWQVRPEGSEVALDTANPVGGAQCVRIEGKGKTTDSSGQVLCTNFVSDLMKLEPGKTYRLSLSLRAAEAGTQVAFMPQAYDAGKYFWARHTGASVGTGWQRAECVFRFPAPGDGDWVEGMGEACIRIDISQGTGTLWVDDVELQEAEALSEWEAWQALGLDLHSVVADPLFVDRAADNYELRPESPAYKLGFERIPREKIGPYRDELRASWPIREAVGAREQMTLDWSRH